MSSYSTILISFEFVDFKEKSIDEANSHQVAVLQNCAQPDTFSEVIEIEIIY